MKNLLYVALLVVSCGAHLALGQDGAQAAKLASIHKIYIADLGRETGADLVRENIRLRLTKSGRFTVVEHPDSADAVLTAYSGASHPPIPIESIH